MDPTRDGQSIYNLKNIAAYVQDTITHNRVTLQLGIRYDQNHDQALARRSPASMILPNHPARRSASPARIRASSFHNFSPRIGFTYDMTGMARRCAHNYAIYWGQVGNGGVFEPAQSGDRGHRSLRVARREPRQRRAASEIYDQGAVLAAATRQLLNRNWNPANPRSPTTLNTVDPKLKNDRPTSSSSVSIVKSALGFAVGGNYIWRRYATSATSQAGRPQRRRDGRRATRRSTFTAPARTCPTGATCPTVTYYQPKSSSGRYHADQHPTASTGRSTASN